MDNEAELNLLRAKCVDGTATLEDMKQAIRILRAGRETARFSAESARKKAKAAVPNANDLLDELL